MCIRDRCCTAPSTFVPAAAAAVDDEIYDDAIAVSPTDDAQVALRGSVAAGGRENTSSVVSQISEYTAEEEEMEGRRWKSGADSNTTVVCALVSQSSEEVYDDVGAAETDNAAFVYDDELYEELDEQ